MSQTFYYEGKEYTTVDSYEYQGKEHFICESDDGSSIAMTQDEIDKQQRK